MIGATAGSGLALRCVMVTKEQRDALRDVGSLGTLTVRDVTVNLSDLLDALDEMERERDAAEARCTKALEGWRSDAAIKSALIEDAERERDNAIASKIEWSQHANNRANERDEATLRAEKALERGVHIGMQAAADWVDWQNEPSGCAAIIMGNAANPSIVADVIKRAVAK